jgi:hypothetical protein
LALLLGLTNILITFMRIPHLQILWERRVNSSAREKRKHSPSAQEFSTVLTLQTSSIARINEGIRNINGEGKRTEFMKWIMSLIHSERVRPNSALSRRRNSQMMSLMVIHPKSPSTILSLLEWDLTNTKY